MSETLEVIRGVIEDVVGPEWSVDKPITMETSFGSDLELESIEFVALAEKLMAGRDVLRPAGDAQA